MLKLALIGRDVSASLSPKMHAFVLGKFGVKCGYTLVSVPPAEFPDKAKKLFTGFDAFNVTVPFKTQIVPLLKELKGEARLLGAVNTVLSRGRVGYNTDGAGFSLMLQGAGIELKGKTALVLGAGGAGRSCIRVLLEGGAEVFAYDRNEERLFAAYRLLGGMSPLTEIPLAPYDLIVNCTGVGMHETVGKTPVVALFGGSAEPVGEQLLRRSGTAVDLIYEPKESEFLRRARELKKPTLSGEAMLFYQAYYADCIFTGRDPSPSEASALYRQYAEG